MITCIGNISPFWSPRVTEFRQFVWAINHIFLTHWPYHLLKHKNSLFNKAAALTKYLLQLSRSKTSFLKNSRMNFGSTRPQTMELVALMMRLTSPGRGLWMVEMVPGWSLFTSWHKSTPSDTDSPRSSASSTFSSASISWKWPTHTSNYSVTFKSQPFLTKLWACFRHKCMTNRYQREDVCFTKAIWVTRDSVDGDQTTCMSVRRFTVMIMLQVLNQTDGKWHNCCDVLACWPSLNMWLAMAKVSPHFLPTLKALYTNHLSLLYLWICPFWPSFLFRAMAYTFVSNKILSELIWKNTIPIQILGGTDFKLDFTWNKSTSECVWLVNWQRTYQSHVLNFL